MIRPSFLFETWVQDRKAWRRRLWLLTAAALFGAIVLVVVFYLDRHHAVSSWILSLGPTGVVLAALLMALVSLTPLPGEFLLLMDMRVYGVWQGIGVGWIGSLFGAVVAFVLSRTVGRTLLMRFVTPEQIRVVESWVVQAKMTGVVAARLLPLPSAAVNFALGMLHTVSFWNYFWTAAVTAIPYYAGTALVYNGIFGRWTVWTMVGVLAAAAIWVIGVYARRMVRDHRDRNRLS